MISCLGHLGVLGLRQAMLLQQGIDLIRAPEVVVDLAGLCLSYRRKLNYALSAIVTCAIY
jgi:hypothetical protein